MESYFTNSDAACKVTYEIVDNAGNALAGNDKELIKIKYDRITLNPLYFDNSIVFKLKATGEGGQTQMK